MNTSHLIELTMIPTEGGIHARPRGDLGSFSLKLEQNHPDIKTYIAVEGYEKCALSEMNAVEILQYSASSAMGILNLSINYSRQTGTGLEYLLQGSSETIDHISGPVRKALEQMMRDWASDKYPYLYRTNYAP